MSEDLENTKPNPINLNQMSASEFLEALDKASIQEHEIPYGRIAYHRKANKLDRNLNMELIGRVAHAEKLAHTYNLKKLSRETGYSARSIQRGMLLARYILLLTIEERHVCRVSIYAKVPWRNLHTLVKNVLDMDDIPDGGHLAALEVETDAWEARNTREQGEEAERLQREEETREQELRAQNEMDQVREVPNTVTVTDGSADPVEEAAVEQPNLDDTIDDSVDDSQDADSGDPDSDDGCDQQVSGDDDSEVIEYLRGQKEERKRLEKSLLRTSPKYVMNLIDGPMGILDNIHAFQDPAVQAELLDYAIPRLQLYRALLALWIAGGGAPEDYITRYDDPGILDRHPDLLEKIATPIPVLAFEDVYPDIQPPDAEDSADDTDPADSDGTEEGQDND